MGIRIVEEEGTGKFAVWDPRVEKFVVWDATMKEIRRWWIRLETEKLGDQFDQMVRNQALFREIGWRRLLELQAFHHAALPEVCQECGEPPPDDSEWKAEGGARGVVVRCSCPYCGATIAAHTVESVLGLWVER